MQDALAVRRFQRVDDVDGDAEGVVEGQRPAHGRAVEVLHHEVVRADVVQDADVRMAQRRDGARFLVETLAVRCCWSVLIATVRPRRVSTAL